MVAGIIGGLQLLVSTPIGFTVGPPDGKSNQQWKDREPRREEIRQVKQRDRQQHVNHAYQKDASHGFISGINSYPVDSILRSQTFVAVVISELKINALLVIF